MEAPPASPHRAPVLAVSSNKGGVGKTTVAANLAVYLRALREDLPVLLVSLDDQHTLDRMFRLHPPQAGEGHLKHGWAERSFTRVIQLGQYGVHFVPPPPDVALLKARAGDPLTLRRILDRTEWEGIVILDTKSDLEALTVNALHAADRVVVPVTDWASLEEAAKSFALLERARLDRRRARVLFNLVDRRTRVGGRDVHLFARLHAEVRGRGWPYYKTYLSRSPRVEALNSKSDRPLSILHHAAGTVAHGQYRDLTAEILLDLGYAASAPPPGQLRRPRSPAPARRGAVETLAEGVLAALRRR